MCSKHSTSTPIFWGHGTADPLVTYKIGSSSVDFLKTTVGLSAATAEGSDASALKGVLFKSYAGLQHGAAPEELSDLTEWLKKILPN
jgi:predicted esterase